MIPTGYSFNFDGTCTYLTMAASFIVQAAGRRPDDFAGSGRFERRTDGAAVLTR